MSTYRFPLGADHADRDLARLTADLRALPTAADAAARASRRARWSLRRAQVAAALRHRVRVQGALHDRIASPAHPDGCRTAH